MTDGKILITGGNGMLAGYFSEFLGHKALALGKNDLDIGDPAEFERILSTENIGCVINAAGVSNGEKDHLYNVNAFFPSVLAGIASDKGVPFVYLSSARVFDGKGVEPFTENRLPEPQDDYGFSKCIGEKLVKEKSRNNPLYIIRLPMVLGIRTRKPETQIVNRLIRQARDTGSAFAVNDVFHSPVHATSAVRMIKTLVDEGKPGCYHVTHGEGVSLYDLVKRIITNLDIKAEIVSVQSRTLDGHIGPVNLVLGTAMKPVAETWESAARIFSDEYFTSSGDKTSFNNRKDDPS